MSNFAGKAPEFTKPTLGETKLTAEMAKKLGANAGRDRVSRTPPSDWADEMQKAWLEGYDKLGE